MPKFSPEEEARIRALPIEHLNNGLRSAAKDGNLKAVKLIFELGANDVSGALLSAIENFRVDCARFLLESGANADYMFCQPLCLAIFDHHHEMVRLLIDHGATVHDEDGRVLRFAVASEDSEIHQLLGLDLLDE